MLFYFILIHFLNVKFRYVFPFSLKLSKLKSYWPNENVAMVGEVVVEVSVIVVEETVVLATMKCNVILSLIL